MDVAENEGEEEWAQLPPEPPAGYPPVDSLAGVNAQLNAILLSETPSIGKAAEILVNAAIARGEGAKGAATLTDPPSHPPHPALPSRPFSRRRCCSQTIPTP